MSRLPSKLEALAASLCAMLISGACGSSKTGISSGSGGVTGSGGALPGDGGIVGSGGTTPSSTGTSAGGTGAGGIAPGGTDGGGIGTGGAGSKATGGSGGIAPGGAGGTSPAGTGGSASGGSGTIASGGAGDTGVGGTGVGGTGGKATGGAGGAGTGGVIALDAGCTGTLCTKDAAAIDGGLPSCSGLTSTECSLRKDCHSVYVDPRNCTCTEESCCMRFDHCADGDKADCTGPALCKSMAPVCEGQYYTVGFKDSCYEGCVRKNECTIPACPQTPPTHGSSCGPVDHPCFYQDCAGKGRTLASCAAGIWSVQTAACGSATCQGTGATPAQVTCAEGQVCVRTSTSNVVYTVKPSCVDNTCGASPISPACLTGLSGTCEVQISATGGTVYCVLPSPCEGAGGCDYGYL